MAPRTLERIHFRCTCGRSVSVSADSASARERACSRCLAALAARARHLTLRIHRPEPENT